MNQVYVGGSYFHIYIAILKSLDRKDKSTKSLLILNDHTPGVDKIIPLLEKSGYFDHIIHVPFVTLKRRIKEEQGTLSRIVSRNRFAIEYVDQNSPILQYDSFIRNAEINLFYNLGLSSFYFLIKYKHNFIRMLEDGEHNYHPKVGKFKAWRRRFLLRTAIGEGFDPEVKEIEVQHVHRLSPRVRHKGKTLELSRMRESLSPEEQQKILSLFLNGQTVPVTDGKNLLLITQPLSEDKLMTEGEKIKMYDRILDQYGEGHNIFIKGHPRELTMYSGKLNHAFTEIPRPFPLEMMDFMNGVSFDRGITIFSSSLYNLQCTRERIFLGREFIKEFKQQITQI